MKLNRTFFRGALALILALAAVPSWACLRSCNTGSRSLDCLRLCSRSHALLTQEGQLPSLSSQDCGVSLEQASALAAATTFQLDAPQGRVLASVENAPVALALATTVEFHLRGPPIPNVFLWTQSPPANAPPFFC